MTSRSMLARALVVIAQVVAVSAGVLGCDSRGDFIECRDATSCGLRPGGQCLVNAATDNQFCAYPANDCPSGLRWSELDVESSISGECVAAADGGVADASEGPADAAVDGGIDGTPTCGARIVYAEGAVRRREVFSVNADGSGATNLSNDADHDDTAPSWSPLSGKIAFESDRDGNAEIYVVNENGTGLDNLTESPTTQDRDPVFSPDGQSIAWVRGSRLWVMEFDGSNQREVSALSVPSGQRLAWSPDSRAVAALADGDIQVMPVGGGSAVNITNSSGFTTESQAHFSPLGDKLLFTDAAEIIVANADGSGGFRNITNNDISDSAGAWSPDGQSIVFSSVRGGNQDLYRVPATGGAATRMTTNSERDTEPVWSPDGKLIAFLRKGTGDAAAVVTMRAEGTMEQPFGTVAGKPAWSPCAQ
jgi:TolB protein